MLDPKYIREHAEEIKQNTANRHVNVDIDAYLALEAERLACLQEVEVMRRERNEVAEAMKSATAETRPALIERGKSLKETLALREATLEELAVKTREIALRIPNLTHPDSPIGASDEENLEIKQVGEIKPLSAPLSHVELGKKYDLIDFERGAKVAGAKFYFLKGKMVLLEQALIQWVLQEMVKEGFTPIITPDLARDEVLEGVGFSPRGAETQIYSIENSDLSLVGTAEITLGGMYKDEIIDEDRLPLKLVGLEEAFTVTVVVRLACTACISSQKWNCSCSRRRSNPMPCTKSCVA